MDKQQRGYHNNENQPPCTLNWLKYIVAFNKLFLAERHIKRYHPPPTVINCKINPAQADILVKTNLGFLHVKSRICDTLKCLFTTYIVVLVKDSIALLYSKEHGSVDI